MTKAPKKTNLELPNGISKISEITGMVSSIELTTGAKNMIRNMSISTRGVMLMTYLALLNIGATPTNINRALNSLANEVPYWYNAR